MKATLGERIVAESSDIIECRGYHYFPNTSVRVEWLQKAPRTAKDLECPHGVQFYDLVLDGRRHERVSWVYESPRPAISQVKGRFGFWKDVQVA